MNNFNLLKKENLKYFSKLTANEKVAEHTVLLDIYGPPLKRYFSDDLDLIYSLNTIYKDKEIVNINPLFFLTELNKRSSLRQFIQKLKEEIQLVYGYANYDSKLFNKKLGELQTLESD